MTGDIPVAAIVCTRDEAANIAPCLAALGRFAEIIVVDSASRDGTADIAAAAGARVVPFAWNGRYPKKRQWCLDTLALRFPWVLFVDADEVVTAALAEEIAVRMADGPRHAGYFVAANYVFLGRELRHGLRNRKLVLFDRRLTRFPNCDDLGGPAGFEVEGHYQPVVDGPVGSLRAPMLHWDRKPLAAYFARHNTYSDWEATVRDSGESGRLAALDRPGRRFAKRLFARLPCQPAMAFLHSYVLRLGMLDGAAGFHFAVSRAVYYWMIAVKRRAAAAGQLPGPHRERVNVPAPARRDAPPVGGALPRP
jgi:glycosyltransferase involved in cell wall biosynthesis